MLVTSVRFTLDAKLTVRTCPLQETDEALARTNRHLSCVQPTPHSFGEAHANFGRYYGPSSRCLQESPDFGRAGAPNLGRDYERSGQEPAAACYEMHCRGQPGQRQLYVSLKGRNVEFACPTGGMVDLGSEPGASQHAPWHAPTLHAPWRSSRAG